MKTGTADGSPTGSLGVNSKTSVKIVIINNSSSTIKAVLGISSSKNSIVLGNNMIAVSDEPIYISSTISYDNSNTGIACEDVTCMLNELYKPDIEPGDYVSYTPSMNSYKTETSYTGCSYYQNIYPNELKLWRVLNINDDGTIEIISEHTSSTSVDFSGLTGYRNYVGYLNILASKYETEGITAGSRHFGYDGQTEFINDTSKFTSTAPWACDTTGSCNPVESQGGGDSLYLTDYNRVYNVLGTRIANKVGTTIPAGYFIASRYYSYTNNTYFSFNAKVINTSGNWGYANLYVINNSSSSQTYGRGIRPIVTLKAGLAYKGSGTSTDPWVVSK